jgi:hypothetical protein
LNKTWEGFLNPLHKPCPENQKTCFNGQTAASQWMDTITRFLVTVADDAQDGGNRKERGGLWPHPYLVEMPTAPTYDIPPNTPREQLGRIYSERQRNPAKYVIPPSKEMAELLTALMAKNGYPAGPFGFMGGSAGWYLQKAIFAAAGVNPETWGRCPVCKGQATDPAVKEAYDAWEPTPPPEGPGWQLWETVSEGSPISPVFPTEEAFIQYLIGRGSTRSVAQSFVKVGWVPSGAAAPGHGMLTGIEIAETMGAK